MDYDKIKQTANMNIDRINLLSDELRENIAQNKKSIQIHEQELKELDRLRMSERGWGFEIGIFQMFALLRERVNKDKLIIEIHKNGYDLKEFGDLAEVAGERHALIKEAEKQGLELSEESKKDLEKDLLGFLISEKIAKFENEGSVKKEFLDRFRENEKKAIKKIPQTRNSKESQKTQNQNTIEVME